MNTFLLILATYFIGFYIGRKVGISYAFMRMEEIIEDLQRINKSFKQWNEDNL